MDWVVIEGARPYDGRYQFDIDANGFTWREWGWLKRYSGYLPLNIQEGFDGADPELIMVFSVIALHRAGKIQPQDVPQVIERFMDKPADTTVRMESDTVAEEATEVVPPTSPPSSSKNGDSAGDASKPNSETSTAPASPSGILASGSSGSDPDRWAT